VSKGAPSGGGGNAAFALFALVALGLGGAAVWLHGEAEQERRKLDRYKRDYREMADRMRRPVEQYRKTRKGDGDARAAGEDILTFLSRKAGQAKIPPGLLAIQRNTETKAGPWREQSYSVNLRGNKETPLVRGPIAEFLRLVEAERPAIRARSVRLAFDKDLLSNAELTFAFYELEK
jgi:hypothetical protein